MTDRDLSGDSFDTVEWETETDDGDDVTYTLPARRCRCDGCEGKGKSSRYLGAISAEDRDDWGEDTFAAYMRGAFDRPCGDCRGQGWTIEVDFKALREADAAVADAYEDHLADDAAYDRSCAYERRWGA
jgi:hypothetical protein